MRVQAPWAGNRIQRILLRSSPLAHSPSPDGWNEQPGGGSGWRHFYPNVGEICPRAGRPFPSPAGRGKRQSERIPRTVSRLLVPSADQREQEEPDGTARGERSQAFVSARGKASNTTYRPYSPCPLPSLTAYPTQQRNCQGTTWSL